jgi:hypothetical protein
MGTQNAGLSTDKKPRLTPLIITKDDIQIQHLAAIRYFAWLSISSREQNIRTMLLEHTVLLAR